MEARKKILIVDDDVQILNLVDIILTHNGYRVIRADNGKEAIEQAQKEEPDLLIVDLILPDMNGAEIVQAIQENQVCDAPVIFLTAMVRETEAVDDQLRVKIKDRNYPMIAKPFQEAAFLELIKKVLSQRKR